MAADLRFFVRYADGSAEYACSLTDAKDLGANADGAYRIFQKQRGKWHMVFDSELGY